MNRQHSRWNAVCGESRTHGVEWGKIPSHRAEDYLSLFYRVKFAVPSTNTQTKGDSITFQTPQVEGVIMRRNKVDAQGKHPWKAEATEGDPGVTPAVLAAWFSSVYEPQFATSP